MGMTLTALLIRGDHISYEPLDLEQLVEEERERHLSIVLVDMLLDPKTRRWLDYDLAKNWESL